MKAKRRPVPFFYRVVEPGHTGLHVGQIIVERKGRGETWSRITVDEQMRVANFRAEKVPHSEVPAEAVENAIEFLEENR